MSDLDALKKRHQWAQEANISIVLDRKSELNESIANDESFNVHGSSISGSSIAHIAVDEVDTSIAWYM